MDAETRKQLEEAKPLIVGVMGFILWVAHRKLFSADQALDDAEDFFNKAFKR